MVLATSVAKKVTRIRLGIPIQRGLRTHHQDHVIEPSSFSPRKRFVKKEMKRIVKR
jgi:hypothetical protein